MSLPTQILPDHHRHCDDLFVAAENLVQRADWAAAAPAFERFRAQMNAHFEAEESPAVPGVRGRDRHERRTDADDAP